MRRTPGVLAIAIALASIAPAAAFAQPAVEAEQHATAVVPTFGVSFAGAVLRGAF